VKKSDIACFGRIIISLIIVSYFAIVFIQVMPNSGFRDRARAFVDPVIVLFGLRQRWNLFSPDIRQLNQFATCLITFDDGAVKLYEWPENRKFSFHEEIQRNQMRKFVIDGVVEPQYQHYWPCTAQFIARANSDTKNPPVWVELFFNGINIPPFKEYTKQSKIALRSVDHRTLQLPFFVKDNRRAQGVEK